MNEIYFEMIWYIFLNFTMLRPLHVSPPILSLHTPDRQMTHFTHAHNVDPSKAATPSLHRLPVVYQQQSCGYTGRRAAHCHMRPDPDVTGMWAKITMMPRPWSLNRRWPLGSPGHFFQPISCTGSPTAPKSLDSFTPSCCSQKGFETVWPQEERKTLRCARRNTTASVALG